MATVPTCKLSKCPGTYGHAPEHRSNDDDLKHMSDINETKTETYKSPAISMSHIAGLAAEKSCALIVRIDDLTLRCGKLEKTEKKTSGEMEKNDKSG